MASGAHPSDVRGWSVNDVSEWLRSLELDNLAPIFVENSGNAWMEWIAFYQSVCNLTNAALAACSERRRPCALH
jgi:hypothetical protein